jgi:multidrug resistance efflux pump
MIDQLLDDAGATVQAAVRPRGLQYTPGAAVPPAGAAVGPVPPAARPTPLPKRPKGRLLIGTCLLCLAGFAVWQVWGAFFRYQAYGIVAGHVVEVAAPVGGCVQAVHAREGDDVRQGDLLARLRDPQSEWELERTLDELRVEHARLVGDLARLRWETEARQVETDEAVGVSFEAWSRLEDERARAAELAARTERVRKLYQSRAATPEQFDAVRLAENGQRQKVAQLEQAVRAWRDRAERAGGIAPRIAEQLEPHYARIAALESDLVRHREALRQGEVRSPVNGRIVRWHRRAGETARPAEPLFSVLEEGSIGVILYVPEHEARRYVVGDVLDAEIATCDGPVACRVERLGDQLEAPPDQLARHFPRGQRLLAVSLRVAGATAPDALRPGATVRLPRRWLP